jgi:hypothetical protein
MEKLSALDSIKMLNIILKLFCLLIQRDLELIDDKASVIRFEHSALQPQEMPARGAKPVNTSQSPFIEKLTTPAAFRSNIGYCN